MNLDFNVADRMANVGDIKRQQMDRAGRFGPSDSGSSDTNKPSDKGNVVEEEMNAQEAQDRYAPVFEQLCEAVQAAREACQNMMEGVQSESEQDKQLVKVLDDFIAVAQNIRDSRQDIMAELAPAQDVPPPLKP